MQTPMPTLQRYAVIRQWKGDTEVFGPFVSQSRAERFMYQLPENPDARTFLRPLKPSSTVLDH